MEYSRGEKKAIKRCKNPILLDIILKQQKEIEEYKKKEIFLNGKYIDNLPENQFIGMNKMQYKEYLYLKENSIPKESIREKIEYYKKQNNELDDFTCEIDALEELLGE